MSFGQAISYNLSNMGKFDGRAARSEFWWWILLIWILNFVVQLLTGGLGILSGSGNASGFLGFIGWVISILLIVATLAVGSRRLHDTGKSGWLQLLYLIPCIGWIIIFIMCAQPGTTGDNAYGAPPAN